MTTDKEPEPAKTATEKLAALVALRKDAAKSSASRNGVPGQRASERRAGALAASKSKPALRK